MNKQIIIDYIQRLRIENSERSDPMPDQHLVELIRMIEQIG